MLTRLFVIFGGLLVLVLLAALVVPPFVDWTNYKADFEREASAVLGRNVTVNGTAKARLLPFPSVTFTDVSVAGGPDGQPAMTVDTFSMDAELAPFLRGEVLIFDMRLVHPKGVIDIAADGTVDWTMRPSSRFDASQISIENMDITKGEIELRHESGKRSHLLSEIDATVSAKSLVGPWRMDGTVRLDGLRTRVSLSTGKADPAGKIAVRVRADPDSYPLSIETDGTASIDSGAATYAGDFKIAAENKNIPGAKTLTLRGNNGGAINVTPAKAKPGYRLDGKFKLDHKALAVDAFRFETGPLDDPYSANGKAVFDIGPQPRFSIQAQGDQVQFDDALGGESASSLTLSQRIDALEKVLATLPRPTIPGTVEVNLPAVVAGDTTIRDVKLSAEPAKGGWAVKSLAATLPGRTTLEAEGQLHLDGSFGFTGSLLLAVAQPSGFAAWAATDVDEAIRRLPAAGFKAKVDLEAQRQSFDDLELILGKAKFHGSIDAAEPDDAKSSADIRLDGRDLDIDGLTAFASLFVSDNGANRFADSDLDIKVKAGPVAAWGLSAETIDTALRLHDRVLEVDKLAVTGLAGASISATGRIKDFPSSPTGSIDATVIADDLAPLVNLAAEHYPGNTVLKGLSVRAANYPGLFNDSRVDVVASAAGNDDGTTGVAVSAQGNSGGSAFSASISGQGMPDKFGQAPLTATFTAKNADGTNLLALYGLPTLPLGLVGEATTDVSAKGTLEGGLATTVNVTGLDFKADFDGTAAATGQGLAVKGKAKIDAADIEPWLMTTGMGLPGMGTGTSANLTADADYANGLLVLSGLNGAINEAAVSGDINVEVKGGRPQITGALALDELDLDPAVSMLFGDDAFTSRPGGWPSAPFAQKSVMPFDAELDLTTGALAAGPFATAYDASFSLKLAQDDLSVSDLKAKLYGGALDGLFDIKNSDGTGLLTGQVSLAGADLSAMLPSTGLIGSGTFTTSVSTSGKSVDAMVAALSGAGSASVKGLVVPGLNPDAFHLFTDEADAIGRDINAAQTAEFAPPIAGKGSFRAQDADIAFTVANGVVRAPPITLENPAASLSQDMSLDLNTLAVDGRGSISYKPGDEALVGSEPALNVTLSGPIGAAKRSFDSAPLAQFLIQRALEKEQARVEALQASLLEKQRLRREVRYYASLREEREKAAEEQRRRAEEARLKAEADAKAAADAQAAATAQAEADAKAKAEAEAAAQDSGAQDSGVPAKDNQPAAQPSPQPSPQAAPAPTQFLKRTMPTLTLTPTLREAITGSR